MRVETFDSKLVPCESRLKSGLELVTQLRLKTFESGLKHELKAGDSVSRLQRCPKQDVHAVYLVSLPPRPGTSLGRH